MLLHSSAEFAYIWTGIKRYLPLRSCFGWFLSAWNQCWKHCQDVRFLTLVLIPDPYWKNQSFSTHIDWQRIWKDQRSLCFVLNYKTSINKRPKGQQSRTWVLLLLEWNTCWLWSAEKNNTHTHTNLVEYVEYRSLASFQVSLNSIQPLQSWSQSVARATIFVFRSALNTKLVEAIEIFLPVKFR